MEYKGNTLSLYLSLDLYTTFETLRACQGFSNCQSCLRWSFWEPIPFILPPRSNFNPDVIFRWACFLQVLPEDRIQWWEHWILACLWKLQEDCIPEEKNCSSSQTVQGVYSTSGSKGGKLILWRRIQKDLPVPFCEGTSKWKHWQGMGQHPIEPKARKGHCFHPLRTVEAKHTVWCQRHTCPKQHLFYMTTGAPILEVCWW